MKTISTPSILQIVEEQVQRWRFKNLEDKSPIETINLVTLSREPGSGGRLMAAGIAEKLHFDLFHQEVIHAMAKSAQVSTKMLESVDEKGLSMIEDWVASAVHKRHLWPDEYLQHLLKVIGTIGKHGRAVIVGRGANFVLPANKHLRVRVIAPAEFRAEQVAREHKLSREEARRRILKTESERQAFVRKYFHADIADPKNYDIVLNTGKIQIEEGVEAVCSLLKRD
jgi:cytidylate kinase